MFLKFLVLLINCFCKLLSEMSSFICRFNMFLFFILTGIWWRYCKYNLPMWSGMKADKLEYNLPMWSGMKTDKLNPYFLHT